MCGIAGFFSLSGDTADAGGVERLCDAQLHRGPDSSGVRRFSSNRVVLGHRRLSIIDLSQGADQPMGSADGRFHVVFNGEIYNFKSLRAELVEAGHTFATQSDTEVVLVGYAEWGERILDRLSGMFAFAIYDSKHEKVFLARDPLGIKPLYWFEEAGSIYFSSEVRPLSREKKALAINRAAVAEFLMWGSISSPKTLYENVHALQPGHFIRLERRLRPQVVGYFSLGSLMGQYDSVDEREAAAIVREAVASSVERHLVADVEVSAFLSGGVDSVALLGLMTERGASVRSVNLSFGDTAYDEGDLAVAAAAHYHASHERVVVSPQETSQRVPEAVRALDQPSVDGVNVYFVAEAVAQRGLKVAMSGVGGDELFGGYDSFQRVPQIVRTCRGFRNVPGAAPAVDHLVRSVAARTGRHAVQKAQMVLSGGATFPGAYYASRGLFSMVQTFQLVPGLSATARESLCADSHFSETLGSHNLFKDEEVSTLEIAQYLQSQLLRDTDAMSMRHSLEVRTPLVDRDLYKALFRIPPQLRRLGPAKRLLREAPRVPMPDLIWKRRKQGFYFPIDEWMQSGAISLPLPAHDVLDQRAVQDVKLGYERGQVHWSRYWALLVLGTFLNE